ncbi:MAG: DNA replication/repair protein RecF [Capnocytophaga sp.]|nr:DNA replication/repair protein RecF [Capnocytophaga sp.]
MFLKRLSILNFKNIQAKDFTFTPKINCFVGNNGAGKTNSLDAIYHLGMGKSYFNPSAIQNITFGEEFYLLDGTFARAEREETIVCSVKKGQKKILKRNGKAYERIADHIGSFPVVIVSPADRDLITEGSEERRKFLDGVISQMKNTYLQTLINYNKVLAQRNSLLKYFAENKTYDDTTLSIYDEQLALYGTTIYEERNSFIQNFIPLFQSQYETISQGKENVILRYESSLSKNQFLSILKENRQKDLYAQYTTQGIHKDDLIFEIQQNPIKKFGSQGQQKSFLIALKFAQYHIIKNQTSLTPILLLDDIFDKLDSGRVSQIISLVSGENFGQVFLSDTDSDRTERIVKEIFDEYTIIHF